MFLSLHGDGAGCKGCFWGLCGGRWGGVLNGGGGIDEIYCFFVGVKSLVR